MNWHLADIEKVFEITGSAGKGLSAREAEQRLIEYGPNEIASARKKSPVVLFLRQFKDFMIIVLVGAAILSGFLGELTDTLVIVAIVILNAVVGFIQEYRAEKAMEALKKMAMTQALVSRNGMLTSVPATALVPGDIVLLEAGNIVPADIRLSETANLKINEASLTGEALAVDKQTRPLSGDDIPLGDFNNMAFKGTSVANGRGKGVVVATGMQTELGKIAKLLQQPGVQTTLQKRLAAFGRSLAYIILFICAIVFLVGYLRGENVVLMLLTSLSLAVAAIPEALPAVITIALAIGAKKMVKKNALIRKLSAVETLGSITYICTDKTGTLTLNRMTVEEIAGKNFVFRANSEATATGSGHDYELLMQALALNNDVKRDENDQLIGESTETAMYEFANGQGFLKADVEAKLPRVAEIPFDSDRKCMTTVHRTPEGKHLIIVKGAAEVILQKSANDSERPEWDEPMNRMLNDGLRVLAFGTRTMDDLPARLDPDEIEAELEIIGLAGIIDPPRDEAKQAVQECKMAGIIPVMITGDHPSTAHTIATRLGIISSKDHRTVTGRELKSMTKEELLDAVEHTRVYARVSPEQKLDIVKALQEKGEFVAMTGDGVNDALALKHAEIGVAMGITGTDVTKEASHMILLDDNFATIVKAVKEGRRIYDNIRKFIRYVLTGNSAEIWTIFLAPFFQLPIPLLPMHILWINLVTDGLPGLALTVEPPEKDIMRRPPRHPGQSIFSGGLGVHVTWVGLFLAALTISTQAYALHIGDQHWQTMVFTVLCLGQLAHVMAIRSENRSLFRQGIFTNKPLILTVVVAFLLQLGIIYLPFMNPLFKTQPLTITELATCIAVASLVFVAVEIEKAARRAKGKLLLAAAVIFTLPSAAQISSGQLREIVSDPVKMTKLELRQPVAVKQFYTQNNYRAVWITAIENKNIAVFIKELRQSPRWSLREREYQYNFIRTFASRQGKLATANDSVEAEMLFTDAAFHFYRDIAFGNTVPPLAYNGIEYSPECEDVNSMISYHLAHETLELLHKWLAFRDNDAMVMKARVEYLLHIVSAPGFADVKLRSNRVDTSNIALIKRLEQLGVTDTPDRKFDDVALKKAVRETQRMFNLPEDGMLQPATIQQLNVPLSVRIQQMDISINYSRWLRCLRQTQTVIVVNLSAADMKVYRGIETVLQMKLIVGKRSTPTRTLSSTVDEVILYPYWHVPKNIAVNELLPDIKKDPSYINRNNYQVLNRDGKVIDPHSINWHSLNAAHFPYIIRQSTGCDNALGLIKINFYNPFTIYLHDTPTKNLFSRTRRFYSHGCMRMEKPFDLARLLLKNNTIAVDTVTEKGCVSNKAPIVVNADERMPLIVWYSPAGTDSTERVVFYDDVYEKFGWMRTKR